MGELVVELGEGFSGDDVVVSVDGREVWRGSDVTTNWSIGLADVVRIPTDSSRSSTVEVSARGARVSVDPGSSRLRARLDPAGDLSVEPTEETPMF